MKIVINKGLIYHKGGFVAENVIGCSMADRIARANNLEYAEYFVKEHDGKELEINDETLQIIKKEKPMSDTLKVGIYPGSFNPWHCGHDDILEKALKVFDHVIVAIGVNPEKSEFINTDPKDFKDNFIQQRFCSRVTIVNYSGLLVDEIKKQKEEGNLVTAVIRGLRNGNDLQYEANLQYWNEDLGMEVPTVCFITDRSKTHISSSAIRGVLKFKGDLP